MSDGVRQFTEAAARRYGASVAVFYRDSFWQAHATIREPFQPGTTVPNHWAVAAAVTAAEIAPYRLPPELQGSTLAAAVDCAIVDALLGRALAAAVDELATRHGWPLALGHEP